MLQIVDSSEHILVDSWKKLVEEWGDSSILYCNTDALRQVLSGLVETPDKQYTIISACSDAGIHYQNDAHPNKDLIKMALEGVNWEEVGQENRHYLTVPIGPTCIREYCNPSDKFISKCHRWSFCTFPYLPENVKLYVCNLNVIEDRMYWIPFGINEDPNRAASKAIANNAGRKKDGLLYVNFQDNTMDRINYKKWFKHQQWATTLEKVGTPIDEYIGEIARHKFILCPPGNGLDSYRLYESIYSGSIPILLDSVFARYLLEYGLPVLVLNSYYGITPEFLEKKWEELTALNYDYDNVKLSTYKNLLKSI